ncbi:hypothetical protein BE73_11700 [Xanthomonas oryzae pv. oryzicola]|nr:hypothetical protein BE73_11700 [Xanthomonas oryzae pv. oryzicola]
MIAGLLQRTPPLIDAGILQARRQLATEQQMIDAQTAIAGKVLAEVLPECVNHHGRSVIKPMLKRGEAALHAPVRDDVSHTASALSLRHAH